MHEFPFAGRTSWPQQPNALNHALNDLHQRHVPVIDLTESNPTRCGFTYEHILPALNNPNNLQYSPESKGLLSAREAVQGYYAKWGFSVDTDNILLTSGTSEAYSFLFRLLANHGDKILIPKPSYPLFQFLLELNDCAVDFYPLVYDGNAWHLDRPALSALVDATTKAIVLVNPNNPTGSYISKDDLDFLNGLCCQHQMAIISDEVFLEYAWDDKYRHSCIGNTQALTFVLGGLSKTLAMPQMKCSWMLASGPERVVTEAMARLEIIADTYLSVNTPVQQALPVWLNYAEGMQQQIKQRVLFKWQCLKQYVPANTHVLNVQGGWYASLRIPAVLSEEEWVLTFLNEDHVLVHPGYFFDFSQEAYMVVSLLPQAAIFEDGIKRILKRVGKL